MNAPLGHTGAAVPLMVRNASPCPTEPNMNAESVDPTVSPCRGYTTLIANGPVARGIAGRLGLIGAGGRATAGAGAGAGTGAGAHAAPASSARLRTVNGIRRLVLDIFIAPLAAA